VRTIIKNSKLKTHYPNLMWDYLQAGEVAGTVGDEDEEKQPLREKSRDKIRKWKGIAEVEEEACS